MINIQVIVLLCSICDIDTRVNLKKKNKNILLTRSSIKTQFFIWIFRFWNLRLLLQNAPECTILRKFSKNFTGETPRTPTCGRGFPHPPPFGASHLSEAFGYRPSCSSTFQSCSRGKIVGHPCVQCDRFVQELPLKLLHDAGVHCTVETNNLKLA